MVNKENLIEDREMMFDGMIKMGENSDIWQNKLIYWICKSNYDILEYMLRKEKENESQGNRRM